MSTPRALVPTFDFEMKSDAIIEAFKKVHSISTLELINNFLKNGTEFDLWIFEKRFELDEINIPEEGIYKVFDKKIPPIEKEVSMLILKFQENYQNNPHSLSGRELIILGKAYEYGVVLERNIVKAHHLYLESIEKGCLIATVDIACAFLSGTAFMKNTPLALQYYEKGKNETMFALTGLASCYNEQACLAENELKQDSELEDSELLKEKEANLKLSQKYLELAAAKEEPQALYALGIAYQCGMNKFANSEKNPAKAKNFLERAARRGNPDALTALASWEFVKISYINTDPSYDLNRVFSYLYLAAEFGDHKAKSLFAALFHLSKENIHNAIYDFEQSEDEFLSLRHLGFIFAKGRIEPPRVEPDHVKAAGYLRKAIEKYKDQKSEEALKDILLQHEKLPLEKKNTELRYHATFALGKKELGLVETKSDGPNVREIFTALAKTGSKEFEKLSDKDAWHQVKAMISDSKVADDILSKKMQSLSTTSQALDQALPFIPSDIQNIIQSYLEDKHKDYLNLFFKSKKRFAEADIDSEHQNKKQKVSGIHCCIL